MVKPPVEIYEQPLNLCGELTIYQGPYIAVWMKWEQLGVSLLHSLVKVVPK